MPVTAVLVFVGVAAVVGFVIVVVEVGVLQVLLVRAFWRVFRERILLSRRWQSATHSVRVFGSRSLYARAVSSSNEMPWRSDGSRCSLVHIASAAYLWNFA